MGYPGNQTDLVSILDSNEATPPYPGRFFNKIVGSVAGTWTVKGQGLHKYVAANGQLRSEVFSPGSTGELKEDADVVAACKVSGVTAAINVATTSVASSVVVTRNGVDVTSSITTKPSFDGITVTYADDVGALGAVLVNEHETELEEGDVVTFTLTADTDVTVTYTVREDDLQLSAGYYQFKAETTYDISIGVGEVVEGHFTSIDRATGETAAKCVAYMN
jgi:hypothetical protein